MIHIHRNRQVVNLCALVFLVSGIYATKTMAEEFIWTSEQNGIAKNGQFVRTASPGFQFVYPKTCIKIEVNKPNQIMAMKAPGGSTFSASSREIPGDAKLEEIGPKVFAGLLEKYGSDVHVIFNRNIALRDGTRAYRTDIDWQIHSLKLRTLLVSAFKDRKWVYLLYSIYNGDEATISEEVNKGASIVESLTFK